MGWRALRLSLDRSTLMKAQARALIEAAGGNVLRVMFPMISEPWEYEQARALFEVQVDWTRKAKRKMPTRIEYGAMLEVPSLAEMLDQLLPRVDFISIGTNDLTQFLFAADRSEPRLAQRYDWLSPAILDSSSACWIRRVQPMSRRESAVKWLGVPSRRWPWSVSEPRISRSPRLGSVRSRQWFVPSTPPLFAAAWISCSQNRPRTCARRSRTGRRGMTSRSGDRFRLTLGAQPPNRVYGEARN